MTGASQTGGSLAAELARVWREQGRIGFLLSPEGEGAETRYVEDPVSRVRFRFRWLPHRELRADVAELEARGILDPDRNQSVLFRDSRDRPGRFCFLCADNIRECNPKEELLPIRLAGRDYFAGANFAWIGSEHFTVMDAEHVDQQLSRHVVAAMLDMHAQSHGRFRVIYNGAYAGATIPWHLHLQITSDPFPVESLPEDREESYPTAIERFDAADAGAAAFAYAEEWMGRDSDHHRVNLLVAGPDGTPIIHVFPRDTRRSHAGAKGLMGGFEVCGDFVYSEPDKRSEFDGASAQLARSLLAEIRPEGV